MMLTWCHGQILQLLRSTLMARAWEAVPVLLSGPLSEQAEGGAGERAPSRKELACQQEVQQTDLLRSQLSLE